LSRIALSGNLSGTGTFTIASPNSNSDRTLNLPDAGGTVFVSGQAVTATTGSFSGDVTLGSSVLATPSGSAPSYTCRAWVNFNGTGTVAIRASGNVSSITDNGTGLYTLNFTTALPDANYAYAIASQFSAGSSGSTNTLNNSTGTMTTSALQVATFGSSAYEDHQLVCVEVFR
jgi:hypothetical protein